MLDMDVVKGRIGAWTLSIDCRLSGVCEGVPLAGVSVPDKASSGCCIGVNPNADAARLVGRLPRRLETLEVEDCVRCSVPGRRGLGLTPATLVDCDLCKPDVMVLGARPEAGSIAPACEKSKGPFR